MPTLILSPRYNPDSVILWRTAIKEGWEVERLNSWRVPDDFRPADPVIYGESVFIDVVAEALGVGLARPDDKWLQRLPMHYRRRMVFTLKLNQVLSRSLPWFIKPAGDKSFPSRVYKATEVIPAQDALPGCLPVIQSEPVRWRSEHRFFVRGREPVTGSPYLREGRLLKEDGWKDPDFDDACRFVNDLVRAQTIDLPEAVVVDVGYIQGKGWAVVEANDAPGSGIYGCDPYLVLYALRGAVRTRD